MSGYFGTDTQQLLQQRAEQSGEFVRLTPGACQAARMAATDNPDVLDWSVIDEFLKRDGMFGFRMLDARSNDTVRAHLLERGCRFDTWDVYVAAAERAARFAGMTLPKTYRQLSAPTGPEDEETRALQALMARCGIAPFSGSFLVGEMGPATTVAIGNENGEPVAVAHAYLPHNTHSAFRMYAWVGLVAVDERHRGKGLGTSITSLAIRAASSNLLASHVYSLVSSTNLASQRMIETCGLRPAPEFTCGVAIPETDPRFSR